MTIITSLSKALPDRIYYRVNSWAFPRQEPEIRAIRELVTPGTTAIDVGAWWGPWTYWLSWRAGKVIAFEPMPEAARYLERVTPRNVEVVNVALSDCEGEAELLVPGGRRGCDKLASFIDHRVDNVRRMPVKTACLDRFGFEDVGFVKIDVEGHEAAVLRGAAGTIEKWKPALVVEIEQRYLDQPIGDVFELVRGMGYEGRFLDRRGWLSLDQFEVEQHQLQPLEKAGPEGRGRGYVSNFVFTPR